MSISPFHGGLVFRQDLVDSSYPTLIEEARSTISQISADGSGKQALGGSHALNTGNLNEFFNPNLSSLSQQERYELCCSVGEDITQPDELAALLARKTLFNCYDGFEPSGRMHIAQGIMKAVNVNKIAKCGGVFTFWIADWFALLNNKMGGDLEKIRVVGRYFVEVWKAAGMDLSNVRFLWASDEINKRADEYWNRVMDISRTSTISRIKKCGTIMGRSEGDEQPAAQILYPCMQCADIFFLKADVCQLGLDQRKVNMLARDYCTDPIKPVILSHHMLLGLKQGQEKMSKSDPDSAIFMEDTAKDVERKIKKGFCPEKVLENNPIIDYAKHIVLPALDNEWAITVKKESGAETVVYRSFEQLSADYVSGVLHPGDLKPAVAKAINKLLQPVRDHFANDPYARTLLETIKRWQAELAALR